MYIFKSSGNYIGFVANNNLFSRDGVYLGWIENNLAWDSRGNFKGQLFEINGQHYVLRNTFMIPPISRIPKVRPIPPIPPIPPINVQPITLKIGFADSF